MREQTTRAQLAVGLIGLGRTWETHYRRTVHRLSSKLSVRAVCDAVHMRAAAVAEEFRAATYSSPWQLAQRRDIKAWLILDPGWLGIYPAELAVRHDLPALFANCFAFESQRLTQLFGQAIQRGESLMVEFPNRFAPATTRLRELVATKLGPVQRIEILLSISSCSPTELMSWLHDRQGSCVGLFDWCACLTGRTVEQVEWNTGEHESELRLLVARRPGETEASAPSVKIVLTDGGQGSLTQHRRQVVCERGSAVLTDHTRIAWQTETERADESLTNERSPSEIIIDQFCRRALGGLVPVPTLADAVRGLAVAQAAAESLSAGRRVSVKSSPPL